MPPPLPTTSWPAKRPSLARMPTSSPRAMMPSHSVPATMIFSVEAAAAMSSQRSLHSSRSFPTSPTRTRFASSSRPRLHSLTALQQAVAPGAIPGGGITAPSVNYNSGYSAYVEEEEEPAVIREWREKRDAQIEKRAEQFAAQREETVKEARENIDDFYNNYNAKKEKQISQARKEAEQFLASREDTVSGGTSWERIAKLVDVSGKGAKGGASGSGKERFREILVSLKKDEKAPGASGY